MSKHQGATFTVLRRCEKCKGLCSGGSLTHGAHWAMKDGRYVLVDCRGDLVEVAHAKR